MKITILTYLESEKSDDYDDVVGQIAAALKELGHKVSILGVHGDLKKLTTGLTRRKPDLVFNVMESFGKGDLGAVAIVGLLDLIGVRYTGGGPGEFYLREDKALTKRLLAFEEVQYPEFAVYSRHDEFETGGKLRFPLFVKPLRMDASIGIDSGSLVYGSEDMWKRISKIHKKVKDDALVEEFIEGREFYVGIVGNQTPTAFPPVEMDFSGMPEDAPHILDSKAKWDEDSPEYQGTEAVVSDLPDELRARLQEAALKAYRALRVRDYGRIDMRLTESGEIYVIEVNASCYLEKTSEFARAAAAGGLDYTSVIGRIVEEALQRYEPHAHVHPRTRKMKKMKARG
jgi:D-alanine-D-alanine ligase